MQKSFYGGLISSSWAKARKSVTSRLETNRPAPFERYRHDPEGFADNVLGGLSWWEKQREIARDLVEHQRVLAHTCNNAGKSTFASDLIVWFMMTRRNARVITTAGHGAQVKNLWRKVRHAYQGSRKSLPEPAPNSSEWNIEPEWFAIGRTSDEEATLQGYHSMNCHPDGREEGPGDDGGLLAVIDEASGCRPYVFNAMRGYMTSNNCYWLILGNPNDPEGEFAEMARRPGRFKVHSIDAHDVPFIPQEWIDDQIAYFGPDSPQVQIRVHGQFPKTGGDYAVFPTSFFEAAADLHPRPHDEAGGKHIGADIARGQNDRNCFCLVDEGRVVDIVNFHEHGKGAIMRIAERLADFAVEHGVPWGNVHVDVIGLGAGVVDALCNADMMVDGVDFGANPFGDWDWLIGSNIKPLNRRAELYWAARMALQEGHASVGEEFRQLLWHEANKIQYAIRPDGKTKIEAKEGIKLRTGRSPDITDAWVLSHSRAMTRRLPFVI
jgi:hypothetical protein